MNVLKTINKVMEMNLFRIFCCLKCARNVYFFNLVLETTADAHPIDIEQSGYLFIYKFVVAFDFDTDMNIYLDRVRKAFSSFVNASRENAYSRLCVTAKGKKLNRKII